MIFKTTFILCAFVLGQTVVGRCQAIKTTNFILATRSQGATQNVTDSCQRVSNLQQLKSLLIGMGWVTSGPLPSVDWSKNVLLVVSADQHWFPSSSNYSQDRTKLLIGMEFLHYGHVRAGIYLLTIDGALGSANRCEAVQIVTGAAQNVTTPQSNANAVNNSAAAYSTNALQTTTTTSTVNTTIMQTPP